jgi:hypothetical protein
MSQADTFKAAFAVEGTVPTYYTNASSGDLVIAAGGNIRIGSSGSTGEKLFINTTSGNIGIGTTSPSLKLEVYGASGLPASSGTSQVGIARFSQVGGLAVLDIGNNGSVGSWLQSTRSNDLSVYDPILINPRGGFVGIGTTTPGALLTVGAGGSGGTESDIVIDSGSSSGGSALLLFHRQSALRGLIGIAGANGSIISGSSNNDMAIRNNGPIRFSVNNGVSTSAVLDGSGVFNLTGLAGVGNRCLKADSAGNIVAGTSDCATGGSGADNLGNHIATQNIQLGAFWLSGDGGSEGLQVDSSGTVSASGNFHLTGASAGIYLDAVGTRRNGMTSDSGYLKFRSGTAGTGEQTRMVIEQTTGNVGIGTTTPTEKVEVFGSVSAHEDVYGNSGNILVGSSNSNGPFIAGHTNSSGNSTINVASERILLGGSGFKIQTSPATASGAARTFTDRFYLENSTGNVGIGTTTPNTRLTITSSGANGLNLDRDTGSPTNSGRLFFDSSVATMSIYNFAGNMLFNGSATVGASSGPNLMALTNSGNLGIGTTTPSAKLHITGTAGTGDIFAISSSSNSRLITVTSAGALGIGITNPSRLLHLSSSAQTGVTLQAEGTGGQSYGIISTDNTSSLGGGKFSIYHDGNGARLTIDNAGNVGIGTTTPGRKLVVLGQLQATASGIEVELDPDTSVSRGLIGTKSNHSLSLKTNDTEKMTILTSGNVGIGTTSPQAKLDVTGLTDANGTYGNANRGVIFSGGTGATNDSQFNFFVDNTNAVGVINFVKQGVSAKPLAFQTTGGSVGIGTTNPSAAFDVVATSSNVIGRFTNSDATAYSASNMLSGGRTLRLSNVNGSANFVGEEFFTRSGAFSMIGAVDNGAGTASSLVFGTGSTVAERMRIDSSGNVGIGTTNPSVTLEVNGKLKIDDGGSATVPAFRISSDTVGLSSPLGTDISLITGGATRLNVSSSGAISAAILAGTGNRCLKADSAGNIVAGTSDCATGGSGADNLGNHIATQNVQLNNFFLSNDGGSEGVRVDNSGNVGIGTANSFVGTERLGVSHIGANSSAVIVGDYTTASNLTGIYLRSTTESRISTAGAMTFYTGGPAGTERMRVDSNGNVGIGTTTPAALLNIASATAGTGQIRITSSSAPENYWEIGRENVSTGNFVVSGTNGSGVLTPRFNISPSTGNVGIGTTTPTAKFDVFGVMRSLDGATAPTSGTGLEMYYRTDLAQGNVIAFDRTLGAYKDLSLGNGLMVKASGNVGIGTTTPAAILHLYSASVNGTHFDIQNADTGGKTWELISTGSGNGAGAGKLFFYDGTNNPMTLAGANVGIGTTNPGAKFDVVEGSTLTYASTTAATGNVRSFTLNSSATNNQYASVRLAADGNNGANAAVANLVAIQPTYTSPATDFAIQLRKSDSSFAEQFRVTSSGFVGIGTTSPQSLLHVGAGSTGSNHAWLTLDSGSGTGIPILFFNRNSVNKALISVAYTNDSGVGGSVADDLVIRSNQRILLHANGAAGTAHMVIQNSGNVGIGTTAPLGKLSVATSSNSGTIEFRVGANEASARDFILRKDTSSPFDVSFIGGANPSVDGSTIRFFTSDRAAGEKMTILGTGNVGIGTTNPGQKLEVVGIIKANGTPTGTGIVVSNSGTNSAYFGSEASWLGVGTSADVAVSSYAGSIKFYTNGSGTLRMSLDASGQLTVAGLAGVGNRCLKADSAGNIVAGSSDCATGGSGADNLGNHIATQNVQLNNFWLSNDGGNEGLKVTNGGFVGVGVATPLYNFHVNTGTDQNLHVRPFVFGSSGILINAANDANTVNIPLEFNASVFSFNSGNVGIGLTNPSTALEVRTSGATKNAYVQLKPQANHAEIYLNRGDATSVGQFVYQTGAVTKWYQGMSNSSTAGDGSEYFIGQSSGGASANLWIEANGNIGIGTTTPADTLTIGGASAGVYGVSIRGDGAACNAFPCVRTGGGGSLNIDSVNQTGNFGALVLNGTKTGNIVMATGGGNVGIGTTAPNFKLEVAGTASTTNLFATNSTTTNGTTTNFFATNSNVTNATTTNLFSTTASSTNLFTTNFNADNGTLYIDSTNHRVGLGTTAPTARLDLGTQTPGINTAVTYDTASAGNSTWVQSRGAIYDATSVDQYQVFNGQISGGTKAVPTFTGSPSGGYFMRNVAGATFAASRLDLGYFSGTGAGTTGTSTISIVGDNVGIGTTSPAVALHIQSSINQTLRLDSLGTGGASASFRQSGTQRA